MKRSRIFSFAACLIALLCMLAVTAFAAEQGEFTSGPLEYNVLQDGSVKITKYTGTDKDYTIPSEIDEKAVSVIGGYAFNSVSGLESLTIPGSVKTLENYAVHGCNDLKTVTVEEGLLSSFGLNFEFCRNLKTVNLPENVETLPVFMNCYALEEIRIAEDNPYLCDVDGVVFSKDKKILVRYPTAKNAERYAVPSTVEKIANNAFYDVGENIGDIFVPSTVDAVEEHAFAYTRFAIYTDAASKPEAWRSALAGRTVYYNFTLDAFNSGVTGGNTGEDKELAAPVITSVSQSADAITLNWNKVDGAFEYQIWQVKAGEWKLIETVTPDGLSGEELSFTVTGLEPGTNYKFKLRACAEVSIEEIVYSEYSVAVKVATKPAAPKVSSIAQSAEAINLKWKKVTGANGYVVEQYTSGAWKRIKTITSADTVSHKVKSLNSGTVYKFRIKAYKKVNGETLWSAATPTIKAATKPAAPKVATIAQSTDAINLKWKKVTGANGYAVEQYISGAWKRIKTITSAGTVSHKVKNLESATVYKFRIKAYKKVNGETLWSSATPTIKTATKPAKAKVTLKSDGPGQLTLEWKAVKGADTYSVYYRVNGGKNKLYKTYSSPQKITFKNLKGGDDYIIGVKAGKKLSGETVWGASSTKSAKVTYRTTRYLNAIKSGTYYVKYDVNGEKYAEAVKGDKIYSIGYDDNGIQYRMIYNGAQKKWYYIYDQYKMYTIINDSELPAELRGNEVIKGIKNQTIPTSFKSTKEEIYPDILFDEALFCETATINGVSTKYCYQGTKLVMISTDLGNGYEVEQFIDEFTNKVPDSLFTVPSDYEYLV